MTQPKNARILLYLIGAVLWLTTACRTYLPRRQFAVHTNRINCFAMPRSNRILHAQMGDTPGHTSFVQPQGQQRTPAGNVQAKHDSLLTDRGAYSLKDLSAYCDGTATYANITSTETKTFHLRGGQQLQICPCKCTPIFARELMEGNISIYGATFHWHGKLGEGGTGHHYKAFYARRSDGAMQPFTYNGLCKLVPATDPAYDYLRVYKSAHKAAAICVLGGILPTVLGAAMNTNGDPAHNEAAASVQRGKVILTTAGLAMITASVALLCHNNRNLRRCVASYNHVIE